MDSVLLFDACAMRYSPEFPLAIKDFNLDLKKSMHIGVCGETGAGKSSILSMLFRFCELEQGCIRFTGNDISKMPLFQLRRRMQVVPQFPFLMAGSLAHNLDPFHQYKDHELKYAFNKIFGVKYDDGVLDANSYSRISVKKKTGYEELSAEELETINGRKSMVVASGADGATLRSSAL